MVPSQPDPIPTAKEIGLRIQEWRKRAGFSQETLGKAIGISQSAISGWEGGDHYPDLLSLYKIAELTETRVEVLLGHAVVAVQDLPPSTADQIEKHVRAIRQIVKPYVRRKDRKPPSSARGA